MPSGQAAAFPPPYTVKFDSTEVNTFLGQNNEPSGTETSEYTATVPLQSGSSGFTGTAQGSYARATGTITSKCQAGGKTGTTTETEVSGNAQPFSASVAPGSGSGGTVTVTVGTPPTGWPTENYQDYESCTGYGASNTTPRWYSDFVDEHRSSLAPNSAFTFIFPLTAGSGDTLGTYTSNATFTNGNLQVNETTTITVTQAKCVVPSVVGEPLASAETALTDANCAVGAVTKKKSSTVAVGNVISSSPAAGTEELPGTAVALVVSKGKKAKGKAQCKVPKVVGRKLAAARKLLKKAGCAVGKVSKKKAPKRKRGRVLSERPHAGAKKRHGTKVKLTVGK